MGGDMRKENKVDDVKRACDSDESKHDDIGKENDNKEDKIDNAIHENGNKESKVDNTRNEVTENERYAKDDGCEKESNDNKIENIAELGESESILIDSNDVLDDTLEYDSNNEIITTPLIGGTQSDNDDDEESSDTNSFAAYKAMKKSIHRQQAIDSCNISQQNVYAYSTTDDESEVTSSISSNSYVKMPELKEYAVKKQYSVKLHNAKSISKNSLSKEFLPKLRHKEQVEFNNDKDNFNQCKNAGNKERSLFKKRKYITKIKTEESDKEIMNNIDDGQSCNMRNKSRIVKIKNRKQSFKPKIEDFIDSDGECKSRFRDMMISKDIQNRRKKRADKREREFQQFLKINKMLRKKSKYDDSDASSPERVYCIVKKRCNKNKNIERKGIAYSRVFNKKKLTHTGYNKNRMYSSEYDSSPERLSKKNNKKCRIMRRIMETETEISESDISSPEIEIITNKRKRKIIEKNNKIEKQSTKKEKLAKEKKKMKKYNHSKLELLSDVSDNEGIQESGSSKYRKKNMKINNTVFKSRNNNNNESGIKSSRIKSSSKKCLKNSL